MKNVGKCMLKIRHILENKSVRHSPLLDTAEEWNVKLRILFGDERRRFNGRGMAMV
jgi:hypothetical protein